MRKLVACLAAGVLASVIGSMSPSDQSAFGAGASPPATVANLRADMRKLWEDHITYTRNYIISALAGLPDTDAVAKRLIQNQDDIGTAIAQFYGDEAGQKLASLLKEHIAIATDVVAAAEAGNKKDLEAAQKKWSENAEEIAALLSSANPNWSQKVLDEMLQKHLQFTTGEVVGRLQKNWAVDIKSYDDGHVHMLMFSDMLTDGIVKQFVNQFKS